MAASGRAKKRGSVVQVGSGKPTRRSSLRPVIETTHRRVNRAILRDRKLIAAGLTPLPVRIIASGPAYGDEDLSVRCEDCGGRLDAKSDPDGTIVSGCVCDGPWATPGWVGM